ncbi:MAG: translation elongation factor Ts [bacterium]
MEKPSISLIQDLKNQTGAGMMDCKNALVECGNDIAKATDLLRKKGIARAESKMGRDTGEGLIESYIHFGSRLGVLVEVRSETDFTSRTPEFKQLAHDIAMQIAATEPRWVSRNEVPKEEIAHEIEIYKEEAKQSGKPEKILDKIAEGKLEKFYKDNCLLEQPFLKNAEITVEDFIKENISKFRENILIKRFVRFKIED